MAIPTGSGTEVLKNTSILGFSGSGNGPWSVRWDGVTLDAENSTFAVPTNHIITVLNFSFCNTHETNTYPFSLIVRTQGSATDKFILHTVSVGSLETFVWNEKIVLNSGDKLLFDDPTADGGDDADIMISYIDQDWS